MKLEKAYLTMTSGTHNKHYFIAVHQHPIVPGEFLMCTAWGRIGASLQMPVNQAHHRTYESARLDYLRLVREKLGKGYSSQVITPSVLKLAPPWFFSDADIHALLDDADVIKPKPGANLHPDWEPHPRDHRRPPEPKQTPLQKAMQERSKKARWGF